LNLSENDYESIAFSARPTVFSKKTFVSVFKYFEYLKNWKSKKEEFLKRQKNNLQKKILFLFWKKTKDENEKWASFCKSEEQLPASFF
jgi:hypothetical protein